MLCIVEHHLDQAFDFTTGRSPFAPEALVSGLQLVSPSIRSFAQEDAHEFLRLLIDALKNAARPRYTPRSPGAVHRQEVTEAARLGGSWPFSMFAGLLQSTVHCSSYGHSSRTVDPVEDLELELGAGTVRPTLNPNP